MSELTVEVDDATETLRDLAINELGEELVEQELQSAVNATVTNLYNNREEIKEQLEQADADQLPDDIPVGDDEEE